MKEAQSLQFKKEEKLKKVLVQAYDLYLDDIYRFVYFKIGGDDINRKEETEDLTSLVFLRTWDHLQKNDIKNTKALRSLLYKIARNLIIDHYRKNSKQKNVSYDCDEGSIDVIDERQDLAQKIELAEGVEDVKQKLSELKEEYQEIIIMRYLNELSVSEIAEVLGKTKGNTRVLIHRALNELKNLTNKG